MPLQPKISEENLKLRILDRSKEIPEPDNQDGTYNLENYKFIPGNYDRYTSWFTFIKDIEIDLRRKYFNPYINDNLTFLDVGALCGSWTLPALTLGANVISIEPDPNFFKILENNVKINHFESKWRGINCAVFNENGRAELYDMGEVELNRIDSLGLSNVDYIKIDVEGAETEALQGAEGLLRRNKPYLFIECHLGAFGTFPGQVRNILDFIFGSRYLLETIEYALNTPHIFGRPYKDKLPFCWECSSNLCLNSNKHFPDIK